MGLILGFDRDTLRERVDLADCRDRLDDIRNQRSLSALLEQVWLYKVLGELDEALSVSEEAVRLARMAGTRKDLLRSRVLHASVLHYREAYDAAEQTLNACIMEAEGQGWPNIAAFAAQHLGKMYYDAGDREAARRAFKQALFLRQEAGADDDELEPIFLAIDAVERRTARASGEASDPHSHATSHADLFSFETGAETNTDADADAGTNTDAATRTHGGTPIAIDDASRDAEEGHGRRPSLFDLLGNRGSESSAGGRV